MPRDEPKNEKLFKKKTSRRRHYTYTHAKYTHETTTVQSTGFYDCEKNSPVACGGRGTQHTPHGVRCCSGRSRFKINLTAHGAVMICEHEAIGIEKKQKRKWKWLREDYNWRTSWTTTKKETNIKFYKKKKNQNKFVTIRQSIRKYVFDKSSFWLGNYSIVFHVGTWIIRLF